MDNDVQVSVIIPAFNAEDYVGFAVSSALASHDVCIEVIVVDDGSTDRTWQILEEFGDRIVKMQQQRGGPYRARNLGAGIAQGPWLAFLDADDEWQPNKLAQQIAIAGADPSVGLVYTDCENFGVTHRVKSRQSDSTNLVEGAIFEALLLGNFISMSSVLICKDWFRRLGGFSECHQGVQDWDLWLRFAAEGGRVKLIREPLTRYRIHAGQMTQDLDRRAEERAAVLERALQSSPGRAVSWTIKQKARASLWDIGAWLAAPTQPRKAITWYLLSARYWPWRLNTFKNILKCLINRI